MVDFYRDPLDNPFLLRDLRNNPPDFAPPTVCYPPAIAREDPA